MECKNRTKKTGKTTESIGFIDFADINFECPYCGKDYADIDDKYLNRCNKNKNCCTKIKCDCGNTFSMTYGFMGNAVGFKTEKLENLINSKKQTTLINN